MFQDYTEYSTIQGLIYIFTPQQTTIGRIFWSVVLILMLMLGIYWCQEAYIAWKNQPVLTTVKTTAYPVYEVIILRQKSSVKICNVFFEEAYLCPLSDTKDKLSSKRGFERFGIQRT